MVKATCYMCDFGKAIRVYLPKLERQLAAKRANRGCGPASPVPSESSANRKLNNFALSRNLPFAGRARGGPVKDRSPKHELGGGDHVDLN